MASENDTLHILSAEEIRAAKDIREDIVPVPEWGGAVRIRGLSLKQIAAVATASMRRNQRTGQDDADRELMMMMTLIEGIIEPKFTMADVPWLQEKSAVACTKVVQAINALGPTEDAISEAVKSHAEELNGSVPVLASQGTQDDSSGVA